MTQPMDAALARLEDYIRGGSDAGREADAPAVDAYEEDLFARALAGAAPELAFRSKLAELFQVMNARGTLDLWLTAGEVERVVASGLRVVRFDLDVENPRAPELPAEFDILITRVPVDLTGVRRLDAEVFSTSGERLKLMPEITFDPADGAVFACCEADLARAAASAVQTVTRVWATGEGGRRLLCEIAGI